MKWTAAAVVVLLAGCLSPAQPPGGDDTVDPIRLRVTLSSTTTEPGRVLHGNATVTNAGDVPVRHFGYCDPVVELRFLGPDGSEVAVAAPEARCEALSVETLGSGASRSVPFTFDGRLWEGDTPRPAPGGTYTVLATFTHWPTDATREPLDVPADGRSEVTSRATWTHVATSAEGDVAVDVVALPRTGGGPGTPVEVTATATNRGTAPVVYDENPCMGLRFRFFAPDGSGAAVEAPRACTRDLRATLLAPGGTLRANATFDGTVWKDGAPADAAEGGWRVEAFLVWWEEGSAKAVGTASATTGFAWESPRGIRAGGPELGLRLDRATFGAGETVTLNATATNQGERAVYVDRICQGPFRFALRDDAADDVRYRESFATCLAISLGPFEPGERRWGETTWDGRVRDDAGAATDAPPGTYTFVVRFVWWETPEPEGEPRTTEARVDVAWTG